MGLYNRVTETAEHYIRAYVIGKLQTRRARYRLLYRNDMKALKRVLRPGDIILVEGDYWVSDWIKVFSYHTWTHCGIWIGEKPTLPANIDMDFVEPGGNLIESVLKRGVILSDLDKYSGFNLRICRPIGLSRADIRRVIRFAFSKVGHDYDEDNITQFVHFTFASEYDPTSPIGHCDEEQYTCSSLLAAAFDSVGMPTLCQYDPERNTYVPYHASNVQPKDFDLSVNFQVIKTPAALPQPVKPSNRLVFGIAKAFNRTLRAFGS
jgi:hypothetical protein